MTRATKLHDYHKKFPDGARIDMVIWKLPKPTKERPYGLKYRLNYSLPDGTILVRYDNRAGKADHKHIKNTEFPYTFITTRQLFKDFISDIKANEGAL